MVSPYFIFFFLVKVTVKFIRKETVGRKERQKHFLFPLQEMGAKTLISFLKDPEHIRNLDWFIIYGFPF
jgi:hypothetical protein